MNGLWILFGITVFFLLLFFLPISIKIGYKDDVSLSAGIPGIYFPILPAKKKKINLKKFSYKKHRKRLLKEKEAKEQKKLNDLKKAQKKKDAAKAKKIEKGKKLPPPEPSDEPPIVRVILPLVRGILDHFFGRIQFKILRMNITVGGSDAAQTALLYGAISQGAAYLLELISQKTKFRRARNTYVQIVPDFLLDKIKADVLIIFRLRLIDLISTGLKFLVRFLKEKASQKESLSSKNKSQKISA